jgi:hypothetical protein
MVGQTKLQSFVEANINTCAGFVLAVVVNWLVLPLFGYDVTWADSIGITLVFTVIGVARMYVIRRIFNWWHVGRLT